MYGLGVNRLGVTKTSEAFEWEPTNLFANGEQGVWYDPSDLSSMKQLSDGTVDAVVDQPVGYIEDKSGKGNHAIQATSIKRPTLRQSGSLYYLEFEGGQGLRTTNTIDFTGTDTMTVCTGVKKEVDASENIVELSNNSGGNVDSFRLSVNSGSQYRYSSRGDSALRATSASGYAVPSTNVVTGISKISTDSLQIRVDGVDKSSSAVDQGAGNYGDYQLNIAARNNGGGLQLSGFIYSIVIRNVVSSAEDVAVTEAYVAEKTGVSL